MNGCETNVSLRQMTKQEKIKKMLEMQKKFISKENKNGVTMEEYFVPGDNSELQGYREEYLKLAMEVVDEAHGEVGSRR